MQLACHRRSPVHSKIDDQKSFRSRSCAFRKHSRSYEAALHPEGIRRMADEDCVSLADWNGETPPRPPDVFESPPHPAPGARFQSPPQLAPFAGRFLSFKQTTRRDGRRSASAPADPEGSVDSVFSEASSRTPWEAVYAFRQGRKLVKPTFQGRVYNFLERPKHLPSIIYHSAIYAAILGSLLLSVLISVARDRHIYAEVMYMTEVCLAVVFLSEYCARLWSAGCRSKYLGLSGRLRFLTKPICIIDLIIILSTYFVILFGSDGHTFGAKAIRSLRFLQILRMLHIDREGGCWRLLGSVVCEHRKEMFTSLYIGFLGLVFSSYAMFLIESEAIVNGVPSAEFNSYADALWWGVVTMMTIGYGDKVPLTWPGRLLACVSALFTVSFFALPAGILGSGFALKVQQQQRQKHFSRQIPAAATLIQSLWRCHAADRLASSVATWKIHLVPETSKNIRKRRQKLKSCVEVAVNLEAPNVGMHHSRSVPDMMISMHDDLMKSEASSKKSVFSFGEEDEVQGTRLTKLSEAHKNAIRAIRRIKYFVAKRKFQQARKPYDVGDVIEQYSQGQISMNGRLKDLHRRLDQMLGKTSSSLTDRSGQATTLGDKLQQMDQHMQQMEKKMDNINLILHNLAQELLKGKAANEASCS